MPRRLALPANIPGLITRCWRTIIGNEPAGPGRPGAVLRPSGPGWGGLLLVLDRGALGKIRLETEALPQCLKSTVAQAAV